MPYTDPIAPYVSSLTAPVFALRGLPEEVIAVLFAYYSRSPHGLRENLRTALASGDIAPPEALRYLAGSWLAAAIDSQRSIPIGLEDALNRLVEAANSGGATSHQAQAFHEKWVAGYGHGSVGEHAVAHLGVEGVSILAVKEIEDCRLGTAFTEQSSRFTPFDRDSFTPAYIAGIPEVLIDDYHKACRGLLEAYADVSDRLAEHADRTYPEATPTARRGWVLDRARALLPCGALTRLGLTANGRALAAMVRKLRASHLIECKGLAGEIETAASTVLPSLLRHTEAEPGREGRVARMRAVDAAKPCGPDALNVVEPGVYLRALNITAVALNRAMIRECYPRSQMESQVTYEAVLNAYMGERGPHERHGRAFESAHFSVTVDCNYGAWRDVQRHRTFSAAPVIVSAHSATDLPNDMAEAAGAVAYGRAVEAVRYARKAALSITKHPEGGEAAAQYCLPLGTLISATFDANLRALAQFIELRSGPEGHDDYRKIAWDLYDRLRQNDRLSAATIRCNGAARTMARK